MMEICISSDVYNQYVLVDFNELIVIPDFYNIEKSLSISYEIEPGFDWLKSCNDNIEKNIANLISEIDIDRHDVFCTMVSVDYNNSPIELNYRNKTHFFIGLLISLSKLFKKTIEVRGHVYLYNRTLINNSPLSGWIISRLKFHESLSVKQMKNVYDSTQSYASNWDNDIMVSIQTLYNQGYVDSDKGGNYSITCKGRTLIL